MKLSQSLKLVDTLRNQLFNLLDNCRRFHWTHDFYLEKRAEWYATPQYKNAPLWIHQQLTGLEWGVMRIIWREVEYSYEVKGKRLTIGSPEYSKISPQYISANCTESGCYVWSQAPDKMFTLPGKIVTPIRGN